MSISAPVVLVVDQESFAATLCAALTLHDFHPFHARTVAEALDLLAMLIVDALVVDVRLPDSSSETRPVLALLAVVHAMPMYASLPVVIFTDATLAGDEQHLAAQCGATIFNKPQAADELIKHLYERLGPPALPPARLNWMTA